MLRTEYLTLKDFEIVDVATHCDYKRLDIAIDEALNFDLPETLCEYYDVVLNALNSEEKTEDQLSLLNGGTFKCGKVTKKFLGVKQMLVYYSYANYIYRGASTNTGFGQVKKESDFSIPVPLSEIKEISITFKNMGYSIVKMLKEYICHLPELRKEYDLECDCNCGCVDGKCNQTKTNTFSFKPLIIKKHI